MKGLEVNFYDNVKAKEAIKTHAKTIEKVKNRNKPIREVVQYNDDERWQRITKERTEKETKVYHEGEIYKKDKHIIHSKHLKQTKIKKL